MEYFKISTYMANFYGPDVRASQSEQDHCTLRQVWKYIAKTLGGEDVFWSNLIVYR